jgi:predicted DNA-binding transcriptional regulator AlpA
MLALLTQREAAELLRVTERSLERYRLSGTGPKFIRLGKTRAVRYRPADVEAWLASKVVASTSEETTKGQH